MGSLGLVCVSVLVCLFAARTARAQIVHGGPPGMTGLWHETITLVKMISDAKDKITGTPQPFDPMRMMRHPEQ